MTVTGKVNSGKCSWFGGPNDSGMAETEPLAFLFEVSQAPDLFLDGATEALGRALDPEEYYIAMRWDYDEISKEDLLKTICLVRAPSTSRSFWARPSDWGPHQDTGRLCDISPGLMDALGVETDDELEIIVLPPKTEKEIA
jgi:hypothetical protein